MARRTTAFAGWMLCLWLCLVAAPAAAAANGAVGVRLIEEEVRIQAGPGDHTVAATILRPDGPGPYGVVVLNHGVPETAGDRGRTSAADFQWAAPIFARRGYVVIMPLRRGFGATGGSFAEDTGPCSRPEFVRGESAAADDVMAAYHYARGLAYVDPYRMILAGQSAGAMASLFAAGTRAPEGLVAVLNFAGGRGGVASLTPGTPCAVEPLAQVFEMLGRSVRVPVLFHYAENDRSFGPTATRYWYQKFASGGARAEYVLQPQFGADGHFIFTELVGARHWLPAVEQFLAANGVPFERLDQRGGSPLLAARPPYAESRTCGALYRVFLESPTPRAYAVSTDGRCGFAGGVANARDEAMRQCASVATAPCALYAEGEAVVWKDEAPAAVAGGQLPGPASESVLATGR